MPPVIVAKTHSPEYLIHKYWSRKPANVVRAFIEKYTRQGDLVIDPFCGSGVSIIEALRLGRSALGIDINPIAGLLTKVSIRRIDSSALQKAWNELMEAWLPGCDEAYRLRDGRRARYCVHTTVYKCKICSRRFLGNELSRSGSRYFCPSCSCPIKTGIAFAEGTVVTAIYLESGAHEDSLQLLEQQTLASDKSFCTSKTRSRFDLQLVPNTRVLAYPRMRTSHLFTKRNFSLLARLAASIQELNAPAKVRDALMLVFTSAVASCSRLIAYRNNMKGGGPAWTVPGFWVPAVHLERNPFFHLPMRFSKVERGLLRLSGDLGGQKGTVYIDDAVERLRTLRGKGVKATYIFADPPYGDSVPYLEFSQVWNCWLGEAKIDFDREVVVSDRKENNSGWKEYASRLSRILSLCSDILEKNGHLTLTFNNMDTRAWKALLMGIQNAGMRCVDVMYQIPAVVSAKAQFSPSGSYIGDLYATFRKANAKDALAGWNVVNPRLKEMRDQRGGAVSKVTQMRVATLTILEKNVDARLLESISSHFQKLPSKTSPIPDDSPMFNRIRDILLGTVSRKTSVPDSDLCASVIRKLPFWYGLDQHEILDVARRSGLERSKRQWTQANVQGNNGATSPIPPNRNPGRSRLPQSGI